MLRGLDLASAWAIDVRLFNGNECPPNNRLQGTGTLKVGEASKVLFRSVVLRKSGPVP
jgi:hypothetical protein